MRRCCKENDCRRSVAVEVKSVRTDPARRQFVDLLRCASLFVLQLIKEFEKSQIVT